MLHPAIKSISNRARPNEGLIHQPPIFPDQKGNYRVFAENAGNPSGSEG